MRVGWEEEARGWLCSVGEACRESWAATWIRSLKVGGGGGECVQGAAGLLVSSSSHIRRSENPGDAQSGDALRLEGVWPCLDARLASSGAWGLFRLIQCQEAVPLGEGRKGLKELPLWSSGLTSGGPQARAPAP